jgi:hypothetical protein
MSKKKIRLVSIASASLVVALIAIYAIATLTNSHDEDYKQLKLSVAFSGARTSDGSLPVRLVGDSIKITGTIEAKNDFKGFVAKLESQTEGDVWSTEQELTSADQVTDLSVDLKADKAGVNKFRVAVYPVSNSTTPKAVSKVISAEVLNLKSKLKSFFDAYNSAWGNDSSTGAYFMASNAYPGLYDTKSKAWIEDQNWSIEGFQYVQIYPDYKTLKISTTFIPPDSRCSAHQSEPMPGVTLAIKAKIDYSDQYNSHVEWNIWYYVSYLNKHFYIFNDWNCLPFNNN